MNQSQHEQGGGLTPLRYIEQGRQYFYLLVSAWAITIYLPMRYGSGREHAGSRGLLGMIFPFAFMLFVPDPSVMLVWPIYLVGLIIHRFGHWRAYRRRELVHTQYQGDPWLAMLLFRFRDPVKAWTVGEPLLAVGIGFLLSPLGEGLALYYIFGAGAMLMKQIFDNIGARRYLDQYHDAMIENQYLMSQSRETRRYF